MTLYFLETVKGQNRLNEGFNGLVDPQWQSIIDAEKSQAAIAEHNKHLDR